MTPSVNESWPVTELDVSALRRWPLPVLPETGDKEDRGRVLVIAGSDEMPGAAILAATSAFRTGAGKVTVATHSAVAPIVAAAVPEARVMGFASRGGGFGRAATRSVAAMAQEFDAVLVGPGMQDEKATRALAAALLEQPGRAKWILDAYAMSSCIRSVGRDATRVLVTPHAGEMSHLTGVNKAAILADPLLHACKSAVAWNAVVAMKGAVTFIASPERCAWRHDGAAIGLAISGSGDALAGIIAGLAARGATLEQAAAWGVLLHARAGDRLSKRIGTVGYLAREIAEEIPALLDALGDSNHVMQW